MSFKPRSKPAKAAMMTEEEQQALQEKFARELEEWMAKLPERKAEAARTGQHLHWKLVKKSIRVGAEREIIYDQKISYTLKPLSKRAQKAEVLLATLEEQRYQMGRPSFLDPSKNDNPAT